MMMRIVLLLLVNVALFAGLRISSVLVFFLLGIGASTSSEKYTNYILIPALFIQLLIIWLFYNNGKFIKNRLELTLLFITSLILFVLGCLNMIPF